MDLVPNTNFDDVVNELNEQVVQLHPQSPSKTKVREPPKIKINIVVM